MSKKKKITHRQITEERYERADEGNEGLNETTTNRGTKRETFHRFKQS